MTGPWRYYSKSGEQAQDEATESSFGNEELILCLPNLARWKFSIIPARLCRVNSRGRPDGALRGRFPFTNH